MDGRMYRSNQIRVGDRITTSPSWLVGTGTETISGRVIAIYPRYALVQYAHGVRGCVPVIPAEQEAVVIPNKKNRPKTAVEKNQIVRKALKDTGITESEYSTAIGKDKSWLSDKITRRELPTAEQRALADDIHLLNRLNDPYRGLTLGRENENVRKALLEYKVTQLALARKMGIATSTMSQRLNTEQTPETQKRMINTIKHIAEERDSHVARQQE